MRLVEVVQGLVRPVVTLSLVSGLLWLVYQGTVDPETFVAIVGPVVGFYYAGRTRKED